MIGDQRLEMDYTEQLMKYHKDTEDIVVTHQRNTEMGMQEVGDQ